MISMLPNFMRRNPMEGSVGAPKLGADWDQTEEKTNAEVPAKPAPMNERLENIN
jgi:hypothetical protein